MKQIKCPVCKLSTGFYYCESVYDKDLKIRLPNYLYQKSYEGSEEYISLRCLTCFNKKVKRSKNESKRARSI